MRPMTWPGTEAAVAEAGVAKDPGFSIVSAFAMIGSGGSVADGRDHPDGSDADS